MVKRNAARDGGGGGPCAAPGALGMYSELSAALASRRDLVHDTEDARGGGVQEAEAAASARRKVAAKEQELHVAEVAGAARRKATAKLAAMNAVKMETSPQRVQRWSSATWDIESASSAAMRPDHAASSVSRQLRRANTSYGMTGQCESEATSAPWPVEALAKLKSINEPPHQPSGKAAADSSGGAAASASAATATAEGSSVSAAASAAAAAFAEFLSASEANATLRAFDSVLRCLELPNASLERLCTVLSPALPHRSRLLLSVLEGRVSHPQYRSGLSPHHKPRPPGMHVVIVGAGPVGLRCAVELALLGANVEMLEARQHFSRLQVLHLWDWVECDLISLGIKLIDPSIFATPDLRRVCTAQLQHSLLKVALLLGVVVRLGCAVDTLTSLQAQLQVKDPPTPEVPSPAKASPFQYSSIQSQLQIKDAPRPEVPLTPPTAEPTNSKSSCESACECACESAYEPVCESACESASECSPAVPSSLVQPTSCRHLDVLVDASGARCGLLTSLGFSQTVALRSARALCIVISLHNRNTPSELELRESTWSSQFYPAEFSSLLSRTGVALENLVYYRSSGAFADQATHYFVMTTTSDALHGYGALKSAKVSAQELCQPANVDNRRLEAYARDAIGAFVPELASHPKVEGQLSLFDFSERKQSSRAVAVVTGEHLGMSAQRLCIITRVGDALQEPFWPEGLGINRGFLGVLDCADLVKGAAAYWHRRLGEPPPTSDDLAPLLQVRSER